MKRFLVVRVSAVSRHTPRGSRLRETALSCPIVTKKLCDIYLPHFMRDFLCFGGGDRAEEVPCGSRVGGKPTYAEAHTLAWSSGSKVLFEVFI